LGWFGGLASFSTGDGKLAGDYLIGFLAVEFGKFYDLPLLKFVEHGVDGGFVPGAEVSDEGVVSFDAVGGFPEVGDEVQNIDLFHGSRILFGS
jgi:hypothetical protein